VIVAYDWRLFTGVDVVVVVAIILVYRLMNRNPDVRRTRWGFFAERDRFDEEEKEPPWPELPPDRPLPFDQQNTLELPPEEEKK
jgi:hypothetical protein